MKKIGLALAAAFVLAGCSTKPEVTYDFIDGGIECVTEGKTLTISHTLITERDISFWFELCAKGVRKLAEGK